MYKSPTVPTEAAFCAAVSQSLIRSGDPIYESGTVPQLTANSGADLTNEEEMIECGYGGLVAEFGLETVIYRGYGQDQWTAKDPGEFEQYEKANGHDLHAQHIFMSAEEAISAMADGTIRGHGAFASIDALQALLIRDGSLEAVSDGRP